MVLLASQESWFALESQGSKSHAKHKRLRQTAAGMKIFYFLTDRYHSFFHADKALHICFESEIKCSLAYKRVKKYDALGKANNIFYGLYTNVINCVQLMYHGDTGIFWGRNGKEQVQCLRNLGVALGTSVQF